MYTVYSWLDLTTAALKGLWVGFLNFVPSLLGSLVVFLIGLFVANNIALLVEKIIDLLKVDRILEKTSIKAFCQKAGIRLDAGFFVGQITRWLLILAFLIPTANILKLTSVADFLSNKIIGILPAVIGAVLIMLLAILFSDFAYRSTVASIKGSGIQAAKMLGSVARWAIIIFAVMTVLPILSVPTNVINIVLIGVVSMFSLAGGLAFGLGGREMASELLKKFRNEIEDN
ncbi:MAG: hypothetical protein WAW33_02545 [Minisyncoccia bacterium]